MIWPFSNKPPRLPPDVETVYEKLRCLLESDAEQAAQYPEPLRTLIRDGLDVDSIPGATGPFGMSVTNPIPVNGPIGEILYLSSLRIGEQRILFHRLKSVEETDVYECVSADGKRWNILFLDMYHPRKSRIPPSGYSTVRNILLSGLVRKCLISPANYMGRSCPIQKGGSDFRSLIPR